MVIFTFNLSLIFIYHFIKKYHFDFMVKGVPCSSDLYKGPGYVWQAFMVVKNSEFMCKLGPRYFTFSKIF